MSELRKNEIKDWQKQRTLLKSFVNKNRHNNILAGHLYNILSQENSSVFKTALSNNIKEIASSCVVKGFSVLGIKDSEVLALVRSLPGNLIKSLDYINHSSPFPQTHGSSADIIITAQQNPSGGLNIIVYDPLHDSEALSSILPTGLIFAFASSVWDSLPQNLRIKMENIFQDLPIDVFHSVYINKLRNPGRHYIATKNDLLRDLLISFIKTAYNAPFISENQDWQDAFYQALRGMQYLNSNQASEIVKILSTLFNYLDPSANMNNLIRAYQTKTAQIETKVTISHLTHLFDQLHDRGWQAFFRGWIGDATRVRKMASKQTTTSPYYERVPNAKIAMAMDSVRELDADLTKSLRLTHASKTAKNNAFNDLRCSLRRFNDIWQDLDKREKQYARPRLIQIIHVSNN